MSIKCSTCKQIIKDQYFKYQGKYYCQNCGIKCSSCGCKVIEHYRDKAGNILCEKCYLQQYSRQCSCCGQFITQYVKVNQRIYCQKCSKSPNCISCNYPSGKNRVMIDNRIYSCNNCYKTAILEPQQLIKLYQEVNIILKRDFKLQIPAVDYLYLSNLRKMKLVKRKLSSYLKGFYLNKNGTVSLYILRGMSKANTIGVLTHEMVHIWQIANKLNSQNILIFEGFAEWTSYKILELFNYSEQMRLLQINLFAEYRKGLDFFLELERKKGINGVLNFINTTKKV